ncbi:hypothetical protein [Paenibacillus alvei]|nr:hypothetical protein [Paenibacillus alvei]
MNLRLFDNPRYQSLSWREAVEKFMTEVIGDGVFSDSVPTNSTLR